MVTGQVLPYRLALFGVGLPAEDWPEEKDTEDSEEDEELQDDKPNERTAPGLVSETIPVEKPHFFQQTCHLFVLTHKYSNIFSRFFIILSPMHKTITS